MKEQEMQRRNWLVRKSWKKWKWKKKLFVGLCFNKLVEGTESEKCWNVYIGKNWRDPSPLHFTHHATLFHVLPQEGMDQGLKYHWLLEVPSSLHNGCFTLSSPATMAEGLCLHNSGYLHWARKPISLTHSHHLIVSFISGFHIWTLWLKHVILLELRDFCF